MFLFLADYVVSIAEIIDFSKNDRSLSNETCKELYLDNIFADYFSLIYFLSFQKSYF